MYRVSGKTEQEKSNEQLLGGPKRNPKDQRQDDDDDDDEEGEDGEDNGIEEVKSNEQDVDKMQVANIRQPLNNALGIGGSVDVCCMIDEERWVAGTDTGWVNPFKFDTVVSVHRTESSFLFIRTLTLHQFHRKKPTYIHALAHAQRKNLHG